MKAVDSTDAALRWGSIREPDSMERRTPLESEALRPRSVSLTIRGFPGSTEEVIALFGVAADSSGLAGTPALPGKALLKRSYVRFNVDLAPDAPLFQMVPAILDQMGGVDRLSECLRRIEPEYIDIDLVLPVKDSPEQEGGFIPPSSIADLQRIGATLSFRFLDRRK